MLVSLSAAAMACSPEPFRISEPDPATRADAQLNIQLVDELNAGWSIYYLQVFANGWLVWQGVPQRGGGMIARGLPIHSGVRELAIRVTAAPENAGRGQLVAARERFQLRPSTQTLQIVLNENLFFPQELDVELATR